MIALDNSANRMILASNIKVKVSIKKKKNCGGKVAQEACFVHRSPWV